MTNRCSFARAERRFAYVPRQYQLRQLIRSRFTVWSSPGRVSGGCQPGCDEVVECVVEFAPGGGQSTAGGEIVREPGVEAGEAGREDPLMGLGEQHGHLPTVGCELVAVGVWDTFDESFAA